MGLIARSRWLGEPPALLGGDEVFFDDHAGLAGYGLADEIPLTLANSAECADVAAHLAAIETDDEVGVSGSGPVAFLSLPFDGSTPGAARIPAVVVGRTREGRGWLTTIAPAEALPSGGAAVATLIETALATPVAGPDPESFTLRPHVSHAEWCGVVERALAAIAAGQLDKVVLARALDIEADRTFAQVNVLARLARLHPSCLRFAVDGFVGASPELLLRVRDNNITTVPLAGTTGRTGDPEADALAGETLLSSVKERAEHGFVTAQIEAVLAEHVSELTIDEPELFSFRNVIHLGTRVRARSETAALTLLRALHPTPAVAGTPTAAALAFIRQHEPGDRGRYAGPVGWLDGAGNATFAVGIRSAELQTNGARMWAGVGVVAGSDPAAELAETQLKFQAMLAALVRP